MMIYRKMALAAASCLLAASALASTYDDAVNAAFTDNAETLAPLLAKGLDPNTATSSGAGEPLLMLAIRKNANKVIDLLLKQKNLKIDQPNTLKETPLMIAVFLHDNDVAKKLIDHGASVNNPKNWSPLHYAAAAGNKEMVKLLISKGAEVNARTLRGITPLYMAAREADADTVKLLLNAGARKDFCTNDELAPYDIAKKRGNTTDVQNLLKYDHCR